MKRIRTIARRLMENQEGAALVEYGLLVSLIAVASIAALVILGPKIAALFTTDSGSL